MTEPDIRYGDILTGACSERDPVALAAQCGREIEDVGLMVGWLGFPRRRDQFDHQARLHRREALLTAVVVRTGFAE